MTREDIDRLFSHHPIDPDMIERFERLRQATKEFGYVLIEMVPESHDKTRAILHLRETFSAASAALALRGDV